MMGKMQHDKNFIGLIGLGYWGKNILRNLYELGVLHSACDNEDAVIAEHRKKFPEIIESEDILIKREYNNEESEFKKGEKDYLLPIIFNYTKP